ncbi:hypothetical protein SDC9_163944 [bioreactor metagenome]|uniref:Uncharacterized protein n=1 Tax=bioreactor metagenome TaxID=1076179 RepID=A0A645FT27_9ZZZZ
MPHQGDLSIKEGKVDQGGEWIDQIFPGGHARTAVGHGDPVGLDGLRQGA